MLFDTLFAIGIIPCMVALTFTVAPSLQSAFTAQKMKFSIKDFFSKWFGFPAELVRFIEEIRNGKLQLLWSVYPTKILLVLWRSELVLQIQKLQIKTWVISFRHIEFLQVFVITWFYIEGQRTEGPRSWKNGLSN